MQLVEQHIIQNTDSRFGLIDDAAFAAKNLYNAANYQALPRKVSQQVLMLLDRNWKSFFAAMAAYRADPSAFTGKPGLPKYLDKIKGIIDLLVREGIGVLINGKNDGWKQGIALGQRNNQNFVQVPHARFIEMLQYKAALVGIEVRTINESHTSKCSFLESEPIQHHDRHLGRRTQRGMFRTANGRRINADVNGAYNIIRKALPNAFGNGIGGVVVHPVGIAPTN